MNTIPVLYISRMYFSSSRANVHTVSKTAEALSQDARISFSLISTDTSIRNPRNRTDYERAHNITTPFHIETIWSPSGILQHINGRLAFYASALCDNIALAIYITRRRTPTSVLYVRDHMLAPCILFAHHVLGMKFFFEAHYVLPNKFGQYLTDVLARRAHGIVAITKALARYYTRHNTRTTVSYCAASDIEQYEQITQSTANLRSTLGLPTESTILCYTGNIGKTGTGHDYGVSDIIMALTYLPSHYFLLIVGKKATDSNELEELARVHGVSNRVQILPWQPRNTIPLYVRASDILVIPTSGGLPGNSPTKIFEYLGSGRPIVAANTEAITEILRHEHNALIAKPEHPDTWAHEIERIASDSVLQSHLTKNALQEARHFTWAQRAHTIVDLIFHS